jgi:hypothetical protein
MPAPKNIYYVFGYLIAILLVEAGGLIYLFSQTSFVFFVKYQLIFANILIAGVGGVLYCLRGIYLNYSVKKIWGDEWLPWYLIRPFASLICGMVSYIFLKAGLLVLEAKTPNYSSHIGFYALAFIAGLNVDKFIDKIEDLAQSTWGISKSRTASKSDDVKS